MLGRTHMALGAAGAVFAMPLLLHAPWMPLSHVVSHPHQSHILIQQTEFALAAIAGSVVPDLDEAHSLLARKAEQVVQIAVFAAIVGASMVFHLISSLGAWVLVGLAALFLVSRANLMRRVALGLLAAGAIAAALRGVMPMDTGVLLAIWCLGAMLTGHRTFTHSLAGIGVYGCAMYQLGQHFGLSSISFGLILAYALHMVADGVSGGVPLFWPIGSKLGVSLVRTGKLADHLIGAVAVLVFVLKLFR